MSEESVEFMVIGAPKSATTSLCYQLAQHPGIDFSEPKETDFFLKNPRWESRLSSYHALFSGRPGCLKGEGSVQYTKRHSQPEVAARLHAYNPGLKLIYVVRDPVARAISHYTHDYLNGLTRDPVDDALHPTSNYVQTSRYQYQLEPYRELFPEEQIKLMLFEELVRKPWESLEEVCAFLRVEKPDPEGIDLRSQNVAGERMRWGHFPGVAPIRNFAQAVLPQGFRDWAKQHFLPTGVDRPVLGGEKQRALLDFFEEDICAVEQCLGRALPEWRLRD